jgi:hypothetical protein
VRHMPMVDLLYSSKVAMAAATCNTSNERTPQKEKAETRPVPPFRCGLADDFVGRRIGGERRKGSTESGRAAIPPTHTSRSHESQRKQGNIQEGGSRAGGQS